MNAIENGDKQMKNSKSILFRAVRIVAITGIALAVIVFTQMRRQASAHEVDPLGRVVELAEGEHLAEQLSAAPITLVSYGIRSCGQSQVMRSNLQKLAEAYPVRLRVVLVDVNTHAGLASEAWVKSLPDTRLYLGGKPADQRIGAASIENLNSWVSPCIAKAGNYLDWPAGDDHGHDSH